MRPERPRAPARSRGQHWGPGPSRARRTCTRAPATEVVPAASPGFALTSYRLPSKAWGGKGRTRSLGGRCPPPGTRCEPPPRGRLGGGEAEPARGQPAAGPAQVLRALCGRPSPLRAPPPPGEPRCPRGRFLFLRPAGNVTPRAGSPARRALPRLPRLPDFPLLTGCLAAARPGQARAAATNAALFGARRLHAGRRARARLPRTGTILPAQRHLRLLPGRSRHSGGLAALTQHHEDAGLPAMLPAFHQPAGTWPPAHAVLTPSAARLPPSPAPAPERPAPAGRGVRQVAAGSPSQGRAWKQPACQPPAHGRYLPESPEAARRSRGGEEAAPCQLLPRVPQPAVAP